MLLSSFGAKFWKTWCGLCEVLIGRWGRLGANFTNTLLICGYLCLVGWFCRFCLFESMAVVAIFVKVCLRLCWLYVLHLCSTGQVLSDGAFKCSYVSVLQRLVPAVKSEANGWRRLRCCWRMTAQICCPKVDASGR